MWHTIKIEKAAWDSNKNPDIFPLDIWPQSQQIQRP
jgi:hypothetical protein